ncbi:MAG TPA: aminopeptidase P family protein [Gemmatimonadales bacterium]|nr:aminopeptidase P family protein [Gemmatimonadales bacterium]
MPMPAAAQVGSPAGPVPVARLAERREALLDRIGSGIAVIRSGKPRSLDRDFPQDSDYREDNNFFYLTGLEAPGGSLVLIGRKNGPDSTILYLPEREAVTEQWTGSTLGPGPEASRLSGVTEVRDASRGETEIAQVGSGRDRLPVRDAAEEVAAVRQIKDPEEIRRLREAVAITGEGLRAAMRAARPGMHEYELEALVEYEFRRRGAERLGFPSIVGSGPNATILHYDENRRQTRPGELIVMDVGAEYGYYSADVTRTIPVSGRFDPRQRRLYELVLGAQQAAIDAVRPGTDFATLNRIAREYLRRHSGNLCGGSGCERYFVHGLSHWLGMNVHDVGSFARRLEPGMVFTIEPGIYLPEEALGIRIEDDILVTEKGAEVLSSGIPRTVEEVEAAMGFP